MGRSAKSSRGIGIRSRDSAIQPPLLSTDAGSALCQLSRILKSLLKQGYVTEIPQPQDARLKGVTLTRKALVLRDALECTGDQVLAKMLSRLTTGDHRDLLAALATIERLLDLESPTAPATSAARSTPAVG
jgi:hypothetical protein